MISDPLLSKFRTFSSLSTLMVLYYVLPRLTYCFSKTLLSDRTPLCFLFFFLSFFSFLHSFLWSVHQSVFYILGTSNISKHKLDSSSKLCSLLFTSLATTTRDHPGLIQSVSLTVSLFWYLFIFPINIG